MTISLYEHDFAQWAQRQADLLRQGCWGDLDVEHLLEELDSMGASERRELVNRLAILLAHLLKWRYQPQRRGHSWRLTIKIQRLDVAAVLRQNPSLQPRLHEFFNEAYTKAILQAARETGLDETATFPGDCPFSIEQVLDDDYWPDAAQSDLATGGD